MQPSNATKLAISPAQPEESRPNPKNQPNSMLLELMENETIIHILITPDDPTMHVPIGARNLSFPQGRGFSATW
jgi:hypothetical protein